MTSAKITKDQFVALSSALIGVSTSQLSPPLDPIGIADQYFEILTKRLDPSTLAALAGAFPSGFEPSTAAAAALDDEQVGSTCRSIMKLWLLGTWFQPDDPQQPPEVVSSQAYKESLIWKAMQSHPMGYSMFPFGYWEKSPPALDQFIQFSDSKQSS